MNKDQFYQYLNHPELLNDRSLDEIENILSEYPYFQSARLLHIKTLSNQGSLSYERTLKKTSVWIADRSKLFHLLDNRVLLPVDDYYETEKIDYKNLEDDAVIDFGALENVTEFELPSETQKEKAQNDELSQLIMSGAAQSSTFFNVDDKVDLEDFVNTFKKNKTDDRTFITEAEKTSEHRKSLIDTFISEQPKIVPDKIAHEASNNKEPSDNQEGIEMITDTLAKIYTNQGKYEKAILAYEKLSLKYPEKNIYFVGQIQKIKELINNQ